MRPFPPKGTLDKLGAHYVIGCCRQTFSPQRFLMRDVHQENALKKAETRCGNVFTDI